MNMKLTFVALGMLQAVFAFAEEPQTLYCVWDGNFQWKNAQDEDVSWIPGSIACFTDVATKICGNRTPYTMYGMVVTAPARNAFWTDGSGRLTIGVGGVTFTQNGTFAVGASSFATKQIALSADQTWKGPETDSRANFCIGWLSYGDYWRGPLSVGADVHSLTLEGNLNVWLSSPSNDLSAVDVAVKSPACLYLPRQHKVSNEWRPDDAHLRARTLTLDGATFSVAQRVTFYYNSIPVDLPTALDREHLAETLVFRNGGAVSGVEDCTFAIPTLKALSGENAVNVPMSVGQAETAIEFQDNAKLSFTGGLNERGVSATFSATGVGTLSVPATASLSGGFDLGDDVTLEITGGGSFSSPVRGGKEIVSIAPGATNALNATAIADYTGKVIVRSGSLFLACARPTGVEFVVEEGAELIESGGLIVTDVVRTEEEIVVKEGEVLQVFGNGLTAATKVILDGGDLDFKSSGKTVASPILMSQSGYIRSGVDGATNFISGFVTCDITNEVGALKVDGFGCVVFAGGMKMELPKAEGKQWYELTTCNKLNVVGGSVLLTQGDYDLGGDKGGDNLTVGGNDTVNWGKYLGICDGAKVFFNDVSYIQGASYPVVRIAGPKDGYLYSRYPSRLEIGEGGSLEIPMNRYIVIGQNQSSSEIIISGGNLKLDAHDTIYLGFMNYSTGSIYLRSGTLTLNGRITNHSWNDASRLLWYGGTIKLGAKVESPFMNGAEMDGNGVLRTCCQILGDDCILDLADAPNESVANVPAGKEFAEWVGSGTLTVRGGKTCKTFVMNTFPSDVKLRLENGAKVVVPEGAKVYDSTKYSYAWRSPTSAVWGNGTTQWQTGGDIHLEDLQLADATATCISNRIPAKAIDVGTVRVLEGGALDASDFHLAADATSFTNVTFETDATWVIGAVQLDVPGTLTYGASVKAQMDSVPAYAPVLAQAGAALVGNPTVESVGSHVARCTFDAVKRQVLRWSPGLMLLFR